MFYRYLAAITLLTSGMQLQSMLPSAARRSGAMLLNLAQQPPSIRLQSIGKTIKKRANLINQDAYKNLASAGTKFSTSSLTPNSNIIQRYLATRMSVKSPAPPNVLVTGSANRWSTTAKLIAAATSGIGMLRLLGPFQTYKQWMDVQTFTDNISANLAQVSLDEIKTNINKLEDLLKNQDSLVANINTRVKELLARLQNLYITKKYQEISDEAFAQTIEQSVDQALSNITKDIPFFVRKNNNEIAIPDILVKKLITLKDAPTAHSSLLKELEYHIKLAESDLERATSKYFMSQYKANLIALNALKSILISAQPDPHAPHSSDWDSGISLLPF